MTFKHTPVLLQSVIDSLNITPGKKYIDATLGGGGHTRLILEKGGIVLGIDQDEDAIQFVTESLKEPISENKLKVAQGNFRDIKKIAIENGFETVSGILFDLGVSSYQLDTAERGFSIKHNEHLDMRMDRSSELTAYEVVNTYSIEALSDIFMRYGEEDKAVVAAEKIAEQRKIKKIETTGDLIKIIEMVIKRQGMRHPATQIFQAIRIEVNDELKAIKEGLAGGIELLDTNGVLSVISFHSLEDRISKQLFSNWETRKIGTIVTHKPITADAYEMSSNPRARSAKLRVFKKTI